MKLITKCVFYLTLLALILTHREQFLSLWSIGDDFDYRLDDHTFPFEINYDNAEFTYEAVSGYKETIEKFLVFEDYFGIIPSLENTEQLFFTSTILDSSRIDRVSTGHLLFLE